MGKVIAHSSLSFGARELNHTFRLHILMPKSYQADFRNFVWGLRYGGFFSSGKGKIDRRHVTPTHAQNLVMH